MTSPSFDIQTAIFNALSDAVPSIAGGRIYAPAPQGAEHPFVEIGASQYVARDVQGSNGGDETFTLHVWSRPGAGRSHEEVKTIISQISDELHEKSFNVPSRSSTYAWVRGYTVMNDPDGVTLHGVIDLLVKHYS